MTLTQMWDRIEGRRGKRLLTTSHRKPFLLESADRTWGVVVVPESTNKPRPISADDLDSAYHLWQRKGQVRPADLRDEGIAEWSTAYLAALVQTAATG